MRFLQLAAVFIFLALIGNLLKPLYWDHIEDFARQRSDYGVPSSEAEDTSGISSPTGAFVTREGFERFRLQVRERYARVSDIDRLSTDLQGNYATREQMDGQMEIHRSRFDSIAQALESLSFRGSEADSLIKGLVTEDRFTALQGFVQGLNRARRGGGILPTPTGRPSFKRRHLWTGYHQIHPPYLVKTGGAR